MASSTSSTFSSNSVPQIRYTSCESEESMTNPPCAVLVGDWLMIQIALPSLMADFDTAEQKAARKDKKDKKTKGDKTAEGDRETGEKKAEPKIGKVEETLMLILPELGKTGGLSIETSALERKIGDNVKDEVKLLHPKYPLDKQLFTADANRYLKEKAVYAKANKLAGKAKAKLQGGQGGQHAQFNTYTGLRGVGSWSGLGRRSWHSRLATIDIEHPTPDFALEYPDVLETSGEHPDLEDHTAEGVHDRYAIRFDYLFAQAKANCRPDVAVQLSIAERRFAQWASSKRAMVEAEGITFKLGDAARLKVPQQLATLATKHAKSASNVKGPARQKSRGPLEKPEPATATQAGWRVVFPDNEDAPVGFQLVYPTAPEEDVTLKADVQYTIYPDTCCAFWLDKLVPLINRIRGDVQVVMVPGVMEEVANQARWVKEVVEEAKVELGLLGRWTEPSSLLENRMIWRYSNVGKVLVPVIKDQLITHEMALDMRSRVAAGASGGITVIPVVLTVDAGFNLLMQSMDPLPANLRLPVLTQFPTRPMAHVSEDTEGEGREQIILEKVFWDVLYDGLLGFTK